MPEKLPSEEQLRLLMESMGDSLVKEEHRMKQVVKILTDETLKFRDKLKDETGEILTVKDTRTALDALAEHLAGKPVPKSLSPEQKALTQIWIDRLTIFESK